MDQNNEDTLTSLERERRDEQIGIARRRFVNIVDALRDVEFWFDDAIAAAYIRQAEHIIEKAKKLYEEGVTRGVAKNA